MRLLPLTRRGAFCLAGALTLPRGTAAQPGPGRFVALGYHELGEDGRGAHWSISEGRMAQHLAFLRHEGWSFVGIDALLAARDGRRPLPARAVLLTFDDGYDDDYTRVLPLLRAFEAPAVFALVTSWMEAPAGGSFDYDGQPMPRARLITWAQARQMQASGLCEFASHSHDLHRVVPGNPQGNMQPAAVTRIWDVRSRTHETDSAWARRVEADLVRSSGVIARHLGRRPRAMVWPYGRFNEEAVGIARRLGMPVSFTLEPEPGRVDRLGSVGRHLMTGDPGVGALERLMRFEEAPRERVLHVALDALHDEDPARAARNLDLLIERVARLAPTHVHLEAFADPDGDGVAEATYFPNRHLPMRADLFNRVAWQVATRAGVRVFAAMPGLAFGMGGAADLVLPQGGGAPAAGRLRRLSPFAARARALIGEVWEDLAKHAAFGGIVFGADAALAEDEDANPAALAACRAAGLPDDIARIRADAQAAAHWAALKRRALVDLTAEIAERARRWRAPLVTMRAIHAAPVLDPAAAPAFAQALPDFLAAYDRTLVTADAWRGRDAVLRALHARVAGEAQGIARTVFMLPARDPRPVPAARLRDGLRLLQRLGAHHMGWSPDDALAGAPAADVVGEAISARSFPFRR